MTEPVTHHDIMDRIEKLEGAVTEFVEGFDNRLEAVESRLEKGAGQFEHIDTNIVQVVASLEEIKKDTAATKEIVEAWSAVKIFGRFMKWLGGIAVAVAAVAAAIRLFAKGLL